MKSQSAPFSAAAGRFYAALFTLLLFLPIPAAMAQKTVYIDSQNGNDANDGLSLLTPWKSHTMISTVVFSPGDTLAFKKGSQFSGPIEFTASGTEQNPITITAYGEGELPRFTNPSDLDMNGNCIRISGSWIVLENLYFHDTPPTENANRLRSIFKMGAVFNMKGADHNIIRNNVFMKCTKAIQSTGEYTLITHNDMDGPSHALWNDASSGGGWGPMGIQLGIGNQEVCYNTIKNYLTTDSDYGSDGGAIELDDGRYHKDHFYIHHNYTEGNAGFIESSWGADYQPYVQEVHDLRVAFNINYDGQDWLYMWAPCHDCYFDNNTVIRTNDFTSPLNDGAYLDYGGIYFRNNLIVYTRDAYQGPGAHGIIAENNWYLNMTDWSEVHWDTNQAGSGDPGLVNIENGDYHPRIDSPLLEKGLNLYGQYFYDFENNPLPAEGAWPVGALQPKGNIDIETPGSGAVFTVQESIPIQANAFSTVGSISRVVFCANTGPLNEDDTAPYTCTWIPDSAGIFQLTAIAEFGDGTTLHSHPVWILVADGTQSREHVWHSYDVVTATGFQPALLRDEGGRGMTALELYMSSDSGGVAMEWPFRAFSPGPHPAAFNHAEQYWSDGNSAEPYPYAGKSTVDRGSDSGESGAPEPLGVRDFQLHPPESDRLAVAAFVAPFDGTYHVSGLAARRVYNQGNGVTFFLFGPNQNALDSLNATSDRAWVTSDSTHDLGWLSAGDRIYFAVGRGYQDHFYWDAAEIAWTVTKEAGAAVPSGDPGVPRQSALHQNFPNPFNAGTVIPFQLMNEGFVRLQIYDMHGRRIRALISGAMPPGNHRIGWDGTDDSGKQVPSGIYMTQLEAGPYSSSKKMILMH